MINPLPVGHLVAWARRRILERAVEQAKAATSGVSETEMTDLIDEAVQWARKH
jgi:hypothetical protein